MMQYYDITTFYVVICITINTFVCLQAESRELFRLIGTAEINPSNNMLFYQRGHHVSLQLWHANIINTSEGNMMIF